MSSSSDRVDIEDGCGGFGPVQYRAMAWFFSVLLIGLALVYTLRNTDGYNYATNGQYLDEQAYHENRLASTSLHGDSVDERMHGDLVSAREKLGTK